MGDKQITLKIVVGAAIFKDSKILIIKRSNKEALFPGKWELPSGKRKPLEDLSKALEREVFEEVGLKIRPIVPFSTFNYQPEKEGVIKDYIEIDFLAEIISSDIPTLSWEHTDYAWISERDLSEYEMSNAIRQVISEAFRIAKILNIIMRDGTSRALEGLKEA